MKPGLTLLPMFAAILAAPCAGAGFRDDFDARIALDAEARAGWASRSDDGDAGVRLFHEDGRAVIEVDARSDRRNIWWAMIRRSLSGHIDREELARPDRELRVEARVRPSAAPRRINMHFNHSRTTDFHSHLMEYDLADTGWHRISFTTRGFDALPSDDLFFQMALIDWGQDLFRLEIDHITVDVVDPDASGPHLGSPLPYRPELPPLASLSQVVPPAADAMVDKVWPDVNFRSWTDMSGGAESSKLSISSSQIILLRWDLSAFAGRQPKGWGLLELTTDSVQWAPTELEEFGYLRVVEILGGDVDWSRETVTLESFLAGEPIGRVLNGQMMIDVAPAFPRGGKTLISVSPPVLERLISGRTKGLAIYAQGAVNATFHSSEDPAQWRRPKLRFNVHDVRGK